MHSDLIARLHRRANLNEFSDDELASLCSDAARALETADVMLAEGLHAVIDDSQRRWNGSGRHEPLADAITRVVMEHLEKGITA